MTQTFYSTDQASEFLGISPATLETMRVRGGGPQFYRLGRRAIRYTLEDLKEWAKPQRTTAERRMPLDAAP